MAEDNVITASEPPKVPVLGAQEPKGSTLRLKPVIRKPVPGAAAAPQGTALRPGLKLPPKRVIGGARPAATVAAAPLRRPVLAPATPAPASEETINDAVTMRPALTPAAPAAPSPASAPAALSASPVEQLKTITQSMKSITSPIPQQAILRRTGIIADADLSEAQKMAAKARTSRISLSDAIGAAPVQDEGAPMKTIKIMRPGELPGAEPVAEKPAAAAESSSPTPTTVTQRKTLKIARPTGGVKPTGKFTAKKPAAAAPAAKKPVEAPAGDAADVADIADIPEMPAAGASPATAAGKETIPDVPKAVAVIGLILQMAACGVVGAVGWMLVQDWKLFHFCGGCQPWPPPML